MNNSPAVRWASSTAGLRLISGLLLIAVLAGCAAEPAATPAPAATATPAEQLFLPSTPAPTNPPQKPTATAAATQPPVGAEVGMTAPDFTLTLLDNKTKFTMSEMRGRPVWLNFWATWCEICEEENPDMQMTYQRYKDTPLYMLGVNLNENPRIVKPYVEKHGLTWPFAVDRGRRVARLYHHMAQPLHVFVDRNGVISYVYYGAMGHGQMEEQIDALLQ